MAKLRIVIASLLFAIAIAAGAFGIYNYSVYSKAGKSNEIILSNIKVSEDVEASSDILIVPEEGDIEPPPEITYPALDIDFDALYEMNPDFVGVIYVPVLDLYQPIAHSQDDTEYLTTAFDGTKSKAGSIFLKQSCNVDLSSANTVIYGHNMKNGTMFGTLKRFRKEEGLCQQNPYIYIYTKDAVYKYHIFAYYLANKLDTCWSEIESDELYDLYIEKTLGRNDYDGSGDGYEDDFESRPKILTLSTCYATGHKNYTIVNGTFIGIGNISVKE
jgi:sortase B